MAHTRFRNRRDGLIDRDERSALSDLNALVHVGAGILTAHDVFRGWKEPPQPQHDEGEGQERGQPDTWCGVAERQPESGARGGQAGNREVADQHTFERVAMDGSQDQDERRRHRDTDDHRPEQPLLRRQRRAPVAIEQRQPKDHGAGQPTDDEECKNQAHQNWK